MKFLIILSFMFSFLFYNCSSSKNTHKSMTKDFIIEYKSCGGRNPGNEMFFISQDSCYFHSYEWKAEETKPVYFKIDSTELQYLYDILGKYNFFNMKVEKSSLLIDGGAYLFRAGSSKSPYQISNGAEEDIAKQYKKDFYNMLEEIKRFILFQTFKILYKAKIDFFE